MKVPLQPGVPSTIQLTMASYCPPETTVPLTIALVFDSTSGAPQPATHRTNRIVRMCRAQSTARAVEKAAPRLGQPATARRHCHPTGKKKPRRAGAFSYYICITVVLQAQPAQRIVGLGVELLRLGRVFELLLRRHLLATVRVFGRHHAGANLRALGVARRFV